MLSAIDPHKAQIGRMAYVTLESTHEVDKETSAHAGKARWCVLSDHSLHPNTLHLMTSFRWIR